MPERHAFRYFLLAYGVRRSGALPSMSCCSRVVLRHDWVSAPWGFGLFSWPEGRFGPVWGSPQGSGLYTTRRRTADRLGRGGLELLAQAMLGGVAVRMGLARQCALPEEEIRKTGLRGGGELQALLVLLLW